MRETTADATSVSFEVTVDVSQAEAFRVFTEDFDAIKPREHNLLAVDIAETVLEPRAGGVLLDRGVDGSTCQWGRVLAFEPPTRLLLAWDISARWQVQTDPALASEVEIRFVALGPDSTRVELTHRHLDRHLDGWEQVRDGVAADAGWPLYLRRYADLTTA
jgi:uncharacterized protein YndB with AHSA1/START domain